jgi:2-dehydropantoate 2-reductase
MRICIYGAGAIGGYLAAGLADLDGIELSVIARGAHLEAMRANGITLEIGDDRRTVALRATDDPSELGPQDYVIVAPKAHQAWEAAPRIQPLLGETTCVVTCQNGVPWWYFHGLHGPHESHRLESVDPGGLQWETIGPERALGCVVYPATEIVAPGVIHHHYGNRFALGEPDGSMSGRARDLSEALVHGGFSAPLIEDIRSEIWLKLWGNLCFNPISALTRATLDVVATDVDTRVVAKAMMMEAEAIATRLGSSFRVDVERRINGAAKVGAHRTSMLQDLEAGRVMEIDALVTAVQELGRMVGVATPCLDLVLALVRQLGRTHGPYPAFPLTAGADPANVTVA